MNKTINALLFTVFYACSAQAHHSFSTEFAVDGYVTLEGTITEVRFHNPHVQYFLEVHADGEVLRWNLAGQNVAALHRRGINADTISVGDRVTG